MPERPKQLHVMSFHNFSDEFEFQDTNLVLLFAYCIFNREGGGKRRGPDGCNHLGNHLGIGNSL